MTPAASPTERAFAAICRKCEDRLSPGRLGVAVQLPGRTTMLGHRADECFPTASVIKVAIASEVWLRVSEGRLTADGVVDLEDCDRVGGSGILCDLHGVSRMRLSDLATLSITVSDNIASNACLRVCGGPESVNRRLSHWGIDSVRVHRPIKFERATDDAPFTATGSPAGLLSILEHVPEPVRSAMSKCQDDSMVVRGLDVRPFSLLLGTPSGGVSVAHKTGAIEGVRNDLGWIVGGKGTVAYCAMIDGCEDPRWTVDNEACRVLGEIGAWMSRFAIEGEE